MTIFHKKFEDTRIYYFFHLPYDDFYEETQNEKIDYKNSIFEFQPIPSDRYIEKKITSLQQFRKTLENHNLKVKLLKLKEDFQTDIFRVWPLGIVISEKVKTILEEEKVTGFSFDPLF